MEEKKKLSDKIKDHKKEIIIGCTAIAAVVGGIIIYQKIDGMEKIIHDLTSDDSLGSSSVEEASGKSIIIKTFPVKGHIRDIGTRYPSAAKITEALENNIVLQEHQTYVNAHNRTRMVA